MKTDLSLIQHPRNGHPAHQRLLLYQNELCPVPATYRTIRVLSGTALVSQAARDLILSPGHELQLQPGKDMALISLLSGSQLVVELYAN
jgi:hypothetical protein